VTFVRFQSPVADDRGRYIGVFGLTNMLSKRGRLSVEDERFRVEANAWYDAAYTNPATIDPKVYDETLHPVTATWFKTERGLAIGVIVGALTVGKATPYFVRAIPHVGLRPVVLASSFGALIAAILVATGYRDGPYPFAPRPFSWRQVSDVVRVREWRLATSSYLGHMFELYAFWTWVPTFLAASVRQSSAGLVRSQRLVALLAFATIAIGGAGSVWIGAGIAAMSRPSGRTSPASTINPPHSRNAPTAAANPPGCGPAAMSSAAPGVDHAMLTGIRVRSPRTTATTPAATHTASSPDAACRSSAPTARRPASTTGNAPPKPTSAVTTPATPPVPSRRER